MTASTISHWAGFFPVACLLTIALFGLIVWLMWLGRKWNRDDVLPPPRRDARRLGAVPERLR
jgi:hypothetical protein